MGLSTGEIMSALRKRYPAPEYAFLTEIRNSTGSGSLVRSADALAMSCWPSRGLELHGFEVKATRSDWTREKKDPAKAEAIQSFCDRWWLVVGDPAIVQAGELPPTWGLIVPKGKGLVVATEAPKLEPRPITRGFLASVLRSAAGSSASEAEIKEAVSAAREQDRQAREHGDHSVAKSWMQKADQLEKAIAEFERASGVRISQWDAGNIGDAVRVVLDGATKDVARRWKNIRNHALAALADLDALVEASERVERKTNGHAAEEETHVG